MKGKNLFYVLGSLFSLVLVAILCSNTTLAASSSGESTIDTELNSLVSSYYNNGVYLKETVINLKQEVVDELNEHGGFHAGADDLVRVTKFNGGTLTMTIPGNDKYESNYGTDEATGGLTHWSKGGTPRVVISKPTSAETAGDWRNWEEDGMEGYYWTVKDIVAEQSHNWTVKNGVYSSNDSTVVEWFKAIVAPCYVGFRTETANYITLSRVEIEEVDNTLQLRLFACETDSGKFTAGNLLFAQATICQEHTYHVYDENNKCLFCDDVEYTLLGSHEGTSEWNMANNEKVASNGIFHHNVKVTADSEGNIADFSLQIQHRGWENNGERTYFYTISSSNNVLTINNQLGISPWSFTYFDLSEEHKARLTSEEGLDFVVYYNHDEQKMELYIYTKHELVLLHSLNTYYGSMSNFYKIKYALTGTASVTTTAYSTNNKSVDYVCDKLGLSFGNGHDYSEGNCSCGKVNPFTQIFSNAGTTNVNITDNAQKLSSNGIFHQNVSKVATDSNGNLVDFELKLQYRGWENNGERTYFYNIYCKSGVLTMSNQLGKDPWTYTYFALSEEHKERLASEEGLDFWVYYDHTNQKMKLYIITNGVVEELHTLNTYYGSMANFYKINYSLTGTATVNTGIYKVSNTFDPASDLVNFK